jgi:oxygen-independent coproporphyrinogen-3 oxidase
MIRYKLTPSERETYRHYAGLALPRHTSYPIASAWTPEYGPANFREDLHRSSRQGRLLSLYVHVPFCERLCYYCACTKEIVPPEKRSAQDPSQAFLKALAEEIDRVSESCRPPGEVQQIHLGGGSPTFLSPSQLQQLWQQVRRCFAIAKDAEIAIEIDPRITTLEHLQMLRSLGFNRVSLGIQDFAPQVQRAVNRVQSLELVQRLVSECRSLGFHSINFDLIYGLPFQTLESMAETLEHTLALAPDRVAFYRLAVIPDIFRWQRTFRRTDLPAGDLPLELNLLAINRFLKAGYEFIGLDHFAKPNEALAQACRDGCLRRTFQGMTTGKGLDILGFGPSAISKLDDTYAQNRKSSGDWQQALARDLATERGLRLTRDDQLRGELLQDLYCYGAIDKRLLEDRFGMVFDEYFADELVRLSELMDQNLVHAQSDSIRLTVPLGRLLVRVVAAVFDHYLPPTAFRAGLPPSQSSKVG